MVLTFVVSLLLTFFVVNATRKSWDYVVTTSLLHFIICCIGEARVILAVHLKGDPHFDRRDLPHVSLTPTHCPFLISVQ